jgi:hypothetical protein
VLTGEYEEAIGALSLEQGAQDYQVKQQLDVALLARVLRYLGIASQRSPATQAVLPLCHSVAVVTECEPASVLCGAAMIDQIVGWGVPRDLVTAIIVNRTVLPISMGAAEIRSRLGCELLGIVPAAALELLHAFECGMALVNAQPENAAAASFAEIAERFSSGVVVGMNAAQSPVSAASST